MQGHIYELIKPFRSSGNPWKVRVEASKVLLDLEFHYKGLDEAILLFLKFLDEEHFLRGTIRLEHYSLVSVIFPALYR